jgi:hypothetical protein
VVKTPKDDSKLKTLKGMKISPGRHCTYITGQLSCVKIVAI